MTISNSISRRKFFKLTGAAAGGALFLCGGLSFAAMREPEIELEQISFGGDVVMNKKILVAYATKSGSTVQVAEAIGSALSAQGAAVDVRPVKQIKTVDGYSAVIIGSGARMGSWLSEATEFVKQNQAGLNAVPTAFFTVHLLNVDDSATSETNRALYAARARQFVNPKAEGFFAGKMEYAKLSLAERVMASAMRAPEQDLRDWNKIRAWAEQVYPLLRAV